MIKAVILDFDGVILESMDAKTRAFAELFKDYPEHLDEIVAFHLQNGGMNRYPKIRAIYEHILKKPLSDKQLSELCNLFGQLAKDQMRNASFVTGAKEFITSNYTKYFHAIVSATPQDELINIVKERGLSTYFVEVLGFPPGKGQNLKKLISNLGIGADEACFVGDAMADYEGAREAGIPFIGRITSSYNPFQQVDDIITINNLSELGMLLQ